MHGRLETDGAETDRQTHGGAAHRRAFVPLRGDPSLWSVGHS